MNVRLALIFLLGINFFMTFSQGPEQLIEQSSELLNKNSWKGASASLNQLLAEYEEILSPIQKANLYNNLGFVYSKLLEPEKAASWLRKSLEVHDSMENPDFFAYASANLNLGSVYLELVEFDLAKRHLESALTILSIDETHQKAYNHAKAEVARLYEEAGNFEAAFKLYNESYKALKAGGYDMTSEFAEVCANLGRFLIKSGYTKEAEIFIQNSLDIYQALGPDYDIERAESLESRGVFYEKLGRYADAEKIFLEALAIKRAIPNGAEILLIETLNDLGILYRKLGNFPKAESLFLEVVARSEQEIGKDHPYYATAKNNLATIAMEKGDFEVAKEALLESLEIYENRFGEAHPQVADILNNLAQVERKLGENNKALSYYEKVLRIDERIYGKRHPDYATALANVGVLQSAMGNESLAADYYYKSLEIREEVLGEKHPDYASSLKNVGLHHLALGDKKNAEAYFRAAIRIDLEKLKTVFPVMTEKERELFFETMRDDVDRYNSVAFDLLKDDPDLVKVIFDFRVATKAILFNSANKVKESAEQSENPVTRKQYSQWQKEKKLLADYYQMGKQELDQLGVDLSKVSNRVEQLEKNLILELEGFDQFLPQDEITWQSVQSKINPGEAVVEIIRIREFKSQEENHRTLFGFTDFTQYLGIVFVPGKAEPTYVVLGDDFRTEEAQYQKYRNSLEYEVNQKETYDLYWSPIDKALKGITRISVVPDGIYYKMNPNSFLLSEKKFLIDKYYVTYITSCRDLFRENLEVSTQKTYLFANPTFERRTKAKSLHLPRLPGAEEEVKTISSLLEPENWYTRTYLNQNASELRIRSTYNATILHIATHGYFEDQGNIISRISPIKNPLFNSGLYLSGASDTYDAIVSGRSVTPQNDGILTAYEAMSLDLTQTQLVVLSACESGLGSIRNGEGVYGLQRAFMVAGARNLITSIVKVDDNATSELMTSFYEQLIETNSIWNSMWQAQLKLKNDGYGPKVWGSFILIGHG